MKTSVGLILASLLLIGCASPPPKRVDNICDIFDEKRSWYKDAKRSEKRWGSKIPTLMAIMHQESRFHAKAKPPRTKILWIFPGPRKSSAYGYAQVKDGTWDEYRKDTNNFWASRSHFDDAVDFVGWYNAQSRARSGIGLNDSYRLYLAYHEGHGGFNRGSFDNKAWLKAVARKVANRSARYERQLQSCERRFKGPWWWPF